MLEETGTKWKKLRSPPVSEKSEVADAHKAAREQMQKEATQELVYGQSHQPLLVAVSGVSPTERNVAIGESDESVVGDGDAVGVGRRDSATRVLDHRREAWNRRPSPGGTVI